VLFQNVSLIVVRTGVCVCWEGGGPIERFAASHTSPSHTSKSQESPQASKQASKYIHLTSISTVSVSNPDPSQDQLPFSCGPMPSVDTIRRWS
jgi:hypothetical protein